MTPPAINPAEFTAFVLILVRVSLIMFMAPIFGSNLLAANVKIALSLTMSFVLFQTIKVDGSVFPVEIYSFVPLLLSELFVGMTIALMIRLILEAVQLAGQYIGYQMGFAIVNVVNPQTGTQASVLSQISYIIALLIFLAVNGHYMVIRAMVESFELAPPGHVIFHQTVYHEMLESVSRMFVVAVKIGAPALSILFCTKVSMGIIAKTVPQMNVLFVGMPMYIIIGLVVFSFSLAFFVPILGRAVHDVNTSLFKVLSAM